MKQIIYIALAIVLVACGGGKEEKKEEVEKLIEETQTTVILYALYEKDDTLKVVYKADGYFHSDEMVETPVKGSNLPQAIRVDLPKNLKIENVNLNYSYNKAQERLTIDHVEIQRNGKTIFTKEDYMTGKYFLGGEATTFDPVKFNLILHHDKEYPPLSVGSPELEAFLTK
jgi:hypothetical protein